MFLFRASSSHLRFAGFRAVYFETRDDGTDEVRDRAVTQRDDRRPTCHRFDHYEAERFLPRDRE